MNNLYIANFSESTESATVEEPEEEGTKQMTLEEWKKMEEQKRMKSDFKLRKPNEGVDTSQWKGARAYRKSEGEEESGEEEESEEEEDVHIPFCIHLCNFVYFPGIYWLTFSCKIDIKYKTNFNRFIA